MKNLFSLVFIFTISSLCAQVLTPEQKKEIYRDSFLDYDNTYDIDSIRNFQQRQVVEYPPIREADVLWSKRVWREIELKEKINLPLYYPIEEIQDRKALFEILQLSYREGLVQVFDRNNEEGRPDDEFTNPITPEQADKTVFGYQFTEEEVVDGVKTGQLVDQVIKITKDEIVAYRLKEDWYFDKQHSQLRVKIIGLQPIASYFNNSQQTQINREPLGWFYFPELRHELVNYEVFNFGNKTQRLTFDDIFIKRKFSSHIVKEENVYNREIEDYKKDPYEALLEGERIKDEINLFEHDLWSY